MFTSPRDACKRANAAPCWLPLSPTDHILYPYSPQSLRFMVAVKLDVTKEIKIDHDNVCDLWCRFCAVHALHFDEKVAIANTLMREMVAHSDAEETSVFNDYPHLGLPGAAERNKEMFAKVKHLVCDVSTADPDYDIVLDKAVKNFIVHAVNEEDEQHPILLAHLTPEENDRVARAFIRAHKMASERATVETTDIQDKVVENTGRRQYVDVKFQHPDPDVW
ncbi:hypothetical protein EVG20_g1993 [Dentipellis fragilis]|uniref:Hemerythrin-like domain-containing protein n=1 Tax=Dentipellis fragilis TaxID=205917 RepID=A0A4Y9ZAX8_9AGAM|nr:hypothetical protein EVG20_g1993 [Dentipellis fragilis]